MKLQFSVIVKLNSDITFNQNSPLQTEKDRLWNEKLKRLHENEKKQTITFSIAAGTKLVLSNGKSFFREIPKIMDAQGRTAFQLQDEIKSIGISRELAYLLGLSITLNMEFLLSQ